MNVVICGINGAMGQVLQEEIQLYPAGADW